MDFFRTGKLEKALKMKAYELYEENGKRNGYDLDDWLLTEKKVLAWYLEKAGLVLDCFGGGGSGIFIDMPDGRLALLTATHVILECVLSGDMSVYINLFGYAVEPSCIRVSAKADVGVLYITNDERIKRLEQDKLYAAPRWEEIFQVKQHIVLLGAPGEWKVDINYKTRKGGRVALIAFETPVTDSDNWYPDLMRCVFVEQPSVLPSSFVGMSGGAVFDEDKNLIGVIHGEKRNINSLGYIYFTPKKYILDVLFPHRFFVVDARSKYKEDFLEIYVLYQKRYLTPNPLRMRINYEFFYKENDSFIGRINYFQLGMETDNIGKYKMNVEATFTLPANSDEILRIQKLNIEVDKILEILNFSRTG